MPLRSRFKTKSVEPIKKESTSAKGLKRICCVKKTSDGNPKEREGTNKGNSSGHPYNDTTGQTAAKPTFHQMAEGIKVGILSEKFPEINPLNRPSVSSKTEKKGLL